MNEKQRKRTLLISSAIPTVGLVIMGLTCGQRWVARPDGYVYPDFSIIFYFFSVTFLLAGLLRLLEMGAIVFKPFDPGLFEGEGAYDVSNALFWHYIKPQLVGFGGIAVAGLLAGELEILFLLPFVGFILVPCSAISAALGARQLEEGA